MADKPSETIQPDPKAVNELLANFRREAERRKRELLANLPQQSAIGSHATQDSTANTPQTPAVLDAQARLAQLRASISQKLANTGLTSKFGALPVSTENAFAKPAGPQPNVVVDAEGRMVDAATGQVLEMQRKPPSSVKANLRSKRREDVNKVLPVNLAEDAEKQLKQSAIYDDSLVMRPAQRIKRQFRFYEKGTFEKQGEQLRKKAQVERLNAEIAERADKAGILSAAALSRLHAPSSGYGNADFSGEANAAGIPDAEWWDGELWECYVKAGLPNTSPVTSDLRVKAENVYGELITAEIEHPVQAAPPTSVDKDITLPIMLTKKEQKKLRRQTRREKFKEKQDRVRLGLDPPTEPKVKLSNFMRVLGNDAIQDPTKAESFVKKQMAERKRKHETANESRKLKPEERRAKHRRKLEEDTSEEVHVAVYAVRDLSSKQRQWKVQKNINDLMMSGVVLFYKPLSVVVAEGGPKQQKKLRRLMLHRIKWVDEFEKNADHQLMDTDASVGGNADQDDDNGDGQTAVEIEHAAGCHLVWQGITTKRHFPRPVRVKMFDTDDKIRDFFQQHKCEQYWDAASGSKLMLEQEVKQLRS